MGSDTGWTKLENEEMKLVICGGIINNIEYLDSLQLGEKIANPYNNYINPFYLWEILSKKGLTFFHAYYKDEMEAEIARLSTKIEATKEKLFQLEENYNEITTTHQSNLEDLN